MPEFGIVKKSGCLLEGGCGIITPVMKSTFQSIFLRLTNLGLLSGQGRFVM
jgi:hypothetical protein